METSIIWDLIRTVLIPAIFLLIGGLMHFVRKAFTRLDSVEQSLGDQKLKTAVIESKVDDIRDDIKEIKYNVERLLERK